MHMGPCRLPRKLQRKVLISIVESRWQLVDLQASCGYITGHAYMSACKLSLCPITLRDTPLVAVTVQMDA
eukprot:1158697-Pelagomonas_calceolata.AAC.5